MSQPYSSPSTEPLGPRVDDRRGPLGAILSRLLGPVYYWLDLYDVQRRPSHGKIKTTFALFVAIGITLAVAKHVFAAPVLAPDGLLTLFGFVVLILFASYGLAGLTIWARTKGGGSVEVAGAAARTAIAARRAAAGGDHEASP